MAGEKVIQCPQACEDRLTDIYERLNAVDKEQSRRFHVYERLEHLLDGNGNRPLDVRLTETERCKIEPSRMKDIEDWKMGIQSDLKWFKRAIIGAVIVAICTLVGSFITAMSAYAMRGMAGELRQEIRQEVRAAQTINMRSQGNVPQPGTQ